MKLRTYLTRLVWLCVVPVALLAAYLAYAYVDTERARLKREAESLLQNLSMLLERKIAARITAMEILATSPDLNSLQNLPAFYEEARRVSTSLGGHIILSDLSEQMLLNTRLPLGTPLPRLPRPEGHAAAPAAIATGKPAVGDTVLGPIAKVPLVAIVVPAQRNGQVQALLLNIIETRQFQEELDGVALPADWTIALLDSKGKIIASRGGPRGEGDASGGHLRHVTQLANTRWSLVLEVPNSAYRAALAASITSVVTAILIALLLGLVGSRFAARRLERAVESLAEPDESPRHANIPAIAEFEAIRDRIEEASASLRSGEARYRELFESNPHPMWVYDLESLAFLAVNDAAVAHYGYSRSEFLSMTIMDIRPTDDVRRLLDNVAQVTEGEDMAGLWRHCRKDGSNIFVEIRSHTVRFSGRRAELVLAHDVTTQIDMKESLAEQVEKFRVLAEQTLVGIYILNGEHIEYSNPRASEIFGYERGELVGHSVLEVILDEDKARIMEDVRLLLSGEADRLNDEFRGIRKDGTRVIIGANGMLTRIGGKPVIVGMLQDITDKKRAEETIRSYISRLEQAIHGTIDAVSTMVELRDPYTAGHERRVGELAAAIAGEMGLDEDMQRGLRIAGGVHDIGKITLPAEILSKPARLSAVEYEMVKSHAQQGYEVLKNVDFPWPVAEVARQHHERINGTGYPRGLKGDEILLEARILAVADVVESMASHRPYRPGLGIAKALQEIEQGAGTLYDSVAAAACLRIFKEKGYQLSE